jgi:hypothetical protein
MMSDRNSVKNRSDKRLEVARRLPQKTFRVGPGGFMTIEDAERLRGDEVLVFSRMEFDATGRMLAAQAKLHPELRAILNKENETPPSTFVPRVGTRGHHVRGRHGGYPEWGEGTVISVSEDRRTGLFRTDSGIEVTIEHPNDFHVKR